MPRPEYDYNPVLATELQGILGHGLELAKTSAELRALVSIRASDHDIRKTMQALNQMGVPVVSGPAGFWLTDDPRDIQAYAASLASRKKALEHRMDCLRRIYLRLRDRQPAGAL